MQVKYSDLIAVGGTGILPVFGIALLVSLAAGLVAGGWVGWKLRAGSVLATENAQLRDDIDALRAVAIDLRDRAISNDTKLGAAIARQDAIANTWEKDRETIRLFAEGQQKRLGALLDARPGLRTDRAGDDVLQHWRSSNTGPGATTDATTAPAAGQPDAAVSGPSAAIGRPLGGPHRKPRRRDDALPRMPWREATADRGRTRVGTDRMGLVLRGRRTPGLQAG